jgi:hypothetical protein
MIDADDPASISYLTDGWHGSRLTLVSTNHKDQLLPPNRILYEVNSPRQFTVTWEMLGSGAWQREPSVTCVKGGN